MEIINILGNGLANKISISPPAARGLIKLSIKDEIGPFKPLELINYDDLKSTIQNSLKARLKNLQIFNTEMIISDLMDILNKNQSLITMAGV
ncbi:MAG: hypothetical protein ACFFD5_03765 [Candidatus Thorarchaeota archaeon]